MPRQPTTCCCRLTVYQDNRQLPETLQGIYAWAQHILCAAPTCSKTLYFRWCYHLLQMTIFTCSMLQTGVCFEHSTTFQVCWCPCPNLFVKRCWHPIQNKHLFIKINKFDDSSYYIKHIVVFLFLTEYVKKDKQMINICRSVSLLFSLA